MVNPGLLSRWSFLCLLILTLLILFLFNLPSPIEVFSPAPQMHSSQNITPYQVTDGKNIDSEGGCNAHHHIMFLKAHKCASSTVENIFLRYGYNNNLTLAFPESGNYLGNPTLFQASMIPKKLMPPSGKIDLFTVHSRLNFEEHSKILHNDTIWVTIVRDPVKLYESLFFFYGLKGYYKMNLLEYKDTPLKKLEQLPRFFNKLGRNQMSFDLGYSDDMSVPELERAISELDGMFDLVMVADHMDESLILLRHLLCWTLSDVTVFSKNARRKEVKAPIDNELADVLVELNAADQLLYNHFLAKHRQRVLEFGTERMVREVSELQSLRSDYYDHCVARELGGWNSNLKQEFKEYSDLVSAYEVANNSDENCVMLSLPELELIDKVRRKQLIALGSDKTP